MQQGEGLVGKNSSSTPATTFVIPKQALSQLCRMVSFAQLKLLRLVCREWNIQVSTHPRLRNCTGVLRQDWLYKARGLHFESTLRWRSVYFHFFPFNRNAIFSQYWEQTGKFVTRLQFKYVKISCDRMLAFLMSMPLLEDVSFSQCAFETTKVRLPEPVRPTLRDKPRILKCACPHETFTLPEGTVMPPPRIRRLVLIREDYFPLCLLELLLVRTNGVLEELQFNHARLARWKRTWYRPVPQRVEAKILELVRRNVNTLRRFSFFRNFRGDGLLTRLVDQHINPALVAVSIGQQASWTHMDTAPLFIAYLRSIDPAGLREVTWRLIHRFSGEELSNAIAAKVELRYMFIDTVWCDYHRQNNDVTADQLDFSIILPPLVKLETLHIRDRNRRRFPSMSTNYMDFLPRSVTSLSFYGFYITDDRIATFLRGNSAKQLHTLAIEGGRFVTNETLQLIIKTLPQLECLAVNDSRFLTDSGVTGLPDQACKDIIYCNQRAILTGVPLDLEKNAGVPVSRMTNLSKLSFAGCRKLSDISIYIGIKFPHIKEVDLSRCLNVTDLGLLVLAKNNPTLERIIVMKNYKISRLGLNLVLAANEAIANIHTSKKVRNRDLGKQLPYESVDRFDTAVTYCRWDERRARPMYTD